MLTVADTFEAAKCHLSGVTEENQNSSGHPILVASFKPRTSSIRSGSAASSTVSYVLSAV